MKEYQIISKENIAPKITRLDVYVPQIARKRKAGQFVIVRSREGAERIPLTIADANAEKGTITLVFQGIGKSTIEMSEFNVGDCLKDVAGPLGSPTHIEKFGTVVCVGGGVGIAPLHPITQAMKAAGNEIISIIGAKSSEYFFLKDEMLALSDEMIITTDDGSEGV
ncbi:sulfide/dihydroorotate dehydrogenase-like FAD/NAD-binding protein, partial [bacterium]|nr:sulfide/dihydroorotate dehydrogenase-like FAD/NAD-binding protein [bacterium]